MSTQLQWFIAAPIVLTAVLSMAGALIRTRKSSGSRMTPFPPSRIGCHGRNATNPPWNRGRHPITRKPGIPRLAATILPFYLLTGALATNSRADLIWGNMTYFANGDAALARAAKKYTGAYAFEVEPIVDDVGKTTFLQLTEVKGPYEPDIGHYTSIPVSETAEDGTATFNATKVQEYAPSNTPGGQPRKSGQNNFTGTYFTGFLNFDLTRVGSAYPGTYWSFQSTPCTDMATPEPPTHILWVIGSVGTVAYGWRRRREQRRQGPVGPPEEIE
jgi:hypothetical protein